MVMYPIGITLLIFIPIRTMGIKNQRRLLEFGNRDTDKNEWMHIEIYPDEVFMRINTFWGRKHSKKINMNRDLNNEALILEAIGIFTNYWG